MISPDFPSFRSLMALTSFALLLTGCSINGTYSDATQPDAAKLRFVSDMENATLDVFDEAHCDGATTGILNNMLTGNTRRRAGMTIAPAKESDAYLEIRLKPGKEVFLRNNSSGSSHVCSTGFNFTPEAGAEYELTFSSNGRQCISSMARLSQDGGRVMRHPLVLLEKGLPGCAGSNAIFPEAPAALPATPERTAMIDQIIADSLTPEMKRSVQPLSKADQLKVTEGMVAERKTSMGLTLPDEYWVQYQAALMSFLQDTLAMGETVLKKYKDDYSARLSPLETDELRTYVPDSPELDRSKAAALNALMLKRYYDWRTVARKEGLAAHLSRMAELDRRFGVCERYARCWRN
ncbi:hypothetical protein [Metapseudomonas otitidis]|uniref:hypothetical protein n=1 Tax=Metapseudomonas otitidis TaxID=319939 RepID=UPI00209759BC|nr:hypothetical protein [Pseudomonas otitidis]MCO7552747.1 hypothetical protein [Pseudomonas otitidis]